MTKVIEGNIHHDIRPKSLWKGAMISALVRPAEGSKVHYLRIMGCYLTFQNSTGSEILTESTSY